jgi:hypothetical protein
MRMSHYNGSARNVQSSQEKIRTLGERVFRFSLRRCGHSKSALLQPFTQIFASLECRNSAGRNVNDFAGLGIPSLPGRSLADLEVAKTDELYFLASRQRFRNRREHGLHGSGCVFFGQSALLAHNMDQFRFVHQSHTSQSNGSY